jgi:site-specific DNA-methyltransferase (adenine-specific)
MSAAQRNRTITLTESETERLSGNLLTLLQPAVMADIEDRIIHQDMERAAAFLPDRFVDLLVLDPPYNLGKNFNGAVFSKQDVDIYSARLDGWIASLLHTLKPTATVYICGDWHSSASIHAVASRYFKLRNRITWEREKGRGALSNWKNCSEDIWFCTLGNDYHFDAEAVKLKRKVIAPYRHKDATPKDWDESADGKYRLTYPSNLWTDITVPFWSMPENTEHPTQKPEKLIAKLMLASSRANDVVLDPFLGSGTTAVVAKKLSRKFVGIEADHKYCCIAQKRLEQVRRNKAIQGYNDKVFWERNSLAVQKKSGKSPAPCGRTEAAEA